MMLTWYGSHKTPNTTTTNEMMRHALDVRSLARCWLMVVGRCGLMTGSSMLVGGG